MQEEMNQQPPQEQMAPQEAPPADDAMARQQEQMQQIAATAPMPEKPYTYKAIDKFADSMNKFVGKVAPEMSAAEYNPPEGEKKLDGPLPAEVYVPFAIIMGFISQLGEFDKFITPPESLVSDTALKKATANFGRMEKDKKLLKALQGDAPEQPKEESEMSEAEMASGRMPDDVDKDDEEIMQMM
tara:strand:- start:1193 stop:1747 length:555 start_codon:yes stop_codon:yes gene_type:complete